MSAKIVKRMGPDNANSSLEMVTHWMLIVEGEFICQTSVPKQGELLTLIAEAWNAWHGTRRPETIKGHSPLGIWLDEVEQTMDRLQGRKDGG